MLTNDFLVYDLTTFSSNHPGGIEALESCAGTDGTESYEYAGHSESNMQKMQQYRVGRLAGSPEQASILGVPVTLESKLVKSAASRLKQPGLPRWMSLMAAISMIALVAVLLCQPRKKLVKYKLSTMNTTEPYPRSVSNASIGGAFWSGIAVASLASCVGVSYLYKLFMSTLDYQNEVFSFPPTIPRKRQK